MNLRPLSDQVVIRRDEAEDKTKTGIIIPDKAKEKPSKGTVVKVGPGKTYCHDGNVIVVPVDVKEGDRVLFGKYAAREVDFEGETLLFVEEKDVVAVLE